MPRLPNYKHKRIIIFPGAFNPPTKAHLHAAQLAIQTINPDIFFFCPSKSEYIRNVQKKNGDIFNDFERSDMLRKMIFDDYAFGSLPGCEKMAILFSEIQAKTQPKTFETLDAVQKKYRNAQIYLLLGSDKLPELESGWVNIEYLLATYKLLIIPRSDDKIDEIIAQSPFLSEHKDSFILLKQGVEEKDMSSTQARKYVQKIENAIEHLADIVPNKEVLAYIVNACERKAKV